MLQRKLRYIGTTLTLLMLGVMGAQAQSLPLGSSMPGGNVTKADGSSVALSSLAGSQGTVVIFWSNGCTWVDKYEDRVLKLASTYSDRYGFVLVNANDAASFPQEAPAENQKRASAKKYAMPYVSDGNSALAKAFGAERTPHVFVFDGSGTLVYTGAIDDSPGDPNNVQNSYLSKALDAAASGATNETAQTKPFGCTLKPVGG